MLVSVTVFDYVDIYVMGNSSGRRKDESGNDGQNRCERNRGQERKQEISSETERSGFQASELATCSPCFHPRVLWNKLRADIYGSSEAEQCGQDVE